MKSLKLVVETEDYGQHEDAEGEALVENELPRAVVFKDVVEEGFKHSHPISIIEA